MKRIKGKKIDQIFERCLLNNWSEYLFSVINLCVGLGNFMYFPAKVYEYRGGAYLVAYGFMLAMIGLPLLYLELILGQFHRCSSLIFMRRCAPILQGFGWMSVTSAFLLLYTYQYSVARAFKFLVSLSRSHSQSMPWTSCGNAWNDEKCYEFYTENCPAPKIAHILYQKQCVNESRLIPIMVESAEEQYLQNVVHKIGPVQLSFSNFDWGMFYSLLILWLTIAFVQNRTRSKATVLIYIPTLFVFLVCPFLLVRALHLDGASSGVNEMFTVKWTELLQSKVWLDALANVLTSLSLGMGAHTIIGSFGPPRANTFKIATIAMIVDTSLSLIVTATLYSILGYMKTKIGRESIYEIMFIPSGNLLTHSTFPVLLRQVANNAWMWIFLYYSVLVIVGWKTCALIIKVFVALIADAFRISIRRHMYNIIFMAVCTFLSVSGVILCLDTGPHFIELLQDLQKVLSGAFIIGLLIAVVDIYGLTTIYGDIHILMGRPSPEQWSKVYTWRMWGWRWKMAPAFALLHILTAFFPKSSEKGISFEVVDTGIPIFLALFFIVAHVGPALFKGLYKTEEYMKKHEKHKTFNSSYFFRTQRHLRSWDRIEKQMSAEKKEWNQKHLPENDPEDPDGIWVEFYKSFQEKHYPPDKSEGKKDSKSTEKKKEKSKKNSAKENSLNFDTYHDYKEKSEKKRKRSRSRRRGNSYSD
ncbi:unnamed protein product [Caenorhabditis sp. 36 PRJEB53466]|nr:unnamed protein product [Caenorhabditis sp. 36 PRJEB53466]